MNTSPPEAADEDGRLAAETVWARCHRPRLRDVREDAKAEEDGQRSVNGSRSCCRPRVVFPAAGRGRTRGQRSLPVASGERGLPRIPTISRSPWMQRCPAAPVDVVWIGTCRQRGVAGPVVFQFYPGGPMSMWRLEPVHHHVRMSSLAPRYAPEVRWVTPRFRLDRQLRFAVT